MFKEFKEFAMRGNVLDMAVGIIIGGSFGKIVTSLVNDVLMPPIGRLLGNVDFSNLFIDLSGSDHATLVAAEEAGAPLIKYGAFLNTILDFVIVAFAIFLVIRQVNRLKRKEEEKPAAPTTKECNHCFSEILIKATRCPQCTADLKVSS